MKRRTKIVIKLWLNRLFVAFCLGLIVWANVRRLQNNVFSNYEKATDYGVIFENETSVEPIIAAIFYEGKNLNKGQIKTYFNHSDNYKEKNVKIVIVPQILTEYSLSVIKKLYAELHKHNPVKKIALVYDNENNVKQHKKMLKEMMEIKDVDEYFVTANDFENETLIEKYLNKSKSMVVMLANLNNGLDEPERDFLVEEAVYFAQKHFYNLHVFDVIDTQIARVLDKDYATLFPLHNSENETFLQKQQFNLERYKNRYQSEIIKYLELNIMNLSAGKDIEYPPHNEENYRLYDRGKMVVKLFDANYKEVAEKAKITENGSVISSLIEVAQDVVREDMAEQVKYMRIYLLTDMEGVDTDKDTLLINYLEQDDGVYAVYGKNSAVLLADDRPDNPEDLIPELKKKAGIEETIDDNNIRFYKFKTVEIDYGN